MIRAELGLSAPGVAACRDTRHYDCVHERISLEVDLYDAEKYETSQNYYTPKHSLNAANKIGPSDRSMAADAAAPVLRT